MDSLPPWLFGRSESKHVCCRCYLASYCLTLIYDYSFLESQTRIFNKTHKHTTTRTCTLLETNISPKNGIFEDDFPFPKVGYVNPLEGNTSSLSNPVIPTPGEHQGTVAHRRMLRGHHTARNDDDEFTGRSVFPWIKRYIENIWSYLTIKDLWSLQLA